MLNNENELFSLGYTWAEIQEILNAELEAEE
jgi:hypothetical protein